MMRNPQEEESARTLQRLSETGAAVAPQILCSKHLSAYSKLLFSIFAQIADPRGALRLNHTQFAEVIGFHQSEFAFALDELEAFGLILIEQRRSSMIMLRLSPRFTDILQAREERAKQIAVLINNRKRTGGKANDETMRTQNDNPVLTPPKFTPPPPQQQFRVDCANFDESGSETFAGKMPVHRAVAQATVAESQANDTANPHFRFGKTADSTFADSVESASRSACERQAAQPPSPLHQSSSARSRFTYEQCLAFALNEQAINGADRVQTPKRFALVLYKTGNQDEDIELFQKYGSDDIGSFDGASIIV